MARIRYLKPDFFTDEKLADVSRDARLFYAGLWTAMDRNGIVEGSAKKLRAQIFPFDSLDAEPLMKELENIGRIVRFRHAGNEYTYCPTLGEHQNFHRNEKAKYGASIVQLAHQSAKAQCQPGASTTGNGQRVIGNGQRATGDGERATVPAASEDPFSKIPEKTKALWIETFGESLVKAQLPLCRLGWESDPQRQLDGGVAIYVRRWLENAKKDADREKARAPDTKLTGTPGPVPSAEATQRMLSQYDSIPPPTEKFKADVRRMVASVTGDLPETPLTGRDKAAGKDT